MRHLILYSLFALLCSHPALAWHVEIRNNDAGKPWIWVENNQTLENIDVYLLHFRADDGHFYSYRGQWENGVQPVFDAALDLMPFDAFALTPWHKVCDDTQTCLLGLLAVPHGASLEVENWQASAILPLTLPAAQTRWPGQTVFMPPEATTTFDNVTTGTALDGIASPTTTEKTDDATTPTDTAQTEKPDIFRVEGGQILYANGQAQRLQAIDISDLTQPTLRSAIKLDGSPREVYSLNGYTILLQSDVTQNSRSIGLQLTVLQQAADGQFSIVKQWQSDGRFIESRRRNDVLYVASSHYTGSGSVITVQALRIGAAGDVTAVASADIPAYSYQTEIAIFTDYLVVTGNNDWRSTTVQVYDLRQSGLSALPKLSVPGRIPSEFHVDVRDTYLRLVYGPADRSAGSTLAIYDLADNLTQVGSVGQIAPGEDLFATRFHGDYAYVVTYERVDPLWVIDVSVPSKPQIKGELKVPGWSEKLFFNDNRLFAVGIDDVPLDDGKRVRLVSSSVFDVADPLTPTLLGRFTPLREDGVTYSWSSALSDERALLLDWHDQYAMLPIETWHSTSGVYLQKISLAGDSVSEGGRLDLPVSVQRSVELQPNQFGVLGDQMFLTVDWQGTQARQLGALELAQNLRWLSAEDGQLWTAAHGRNGYYRVYRYDSADLEQAQQSWSVAKAYNYVLSDAEQLVLLNNAPLSVQVLNRDSGELSAPRLLDDSTERYFYSRPLLKDNHLYLSQYNYERYPAIVEPLPTAPTDTLDKEAVADSTTPYPYLRQWTLQDWALDNNRAPQSYTIPGEPLGLTSAGLLVTREADANGLLRLNLLALQGHYARLLDSRSFECYSHTALVWGDADNAYFTCARPYYVIQADNGIDNSNTLFKLNFAAKRIADSGEWTFDKPKNIITAYQNLVLLSDGYYYGYPYYEDTATVGIAVERMTSDALIAPMPPQENTCQVYDLSGAVALALADASQCRSGSVLTQDALYSANGFAGLSKDAAF